MRNVCSVWWCFKKTTGGLKISAGGKLIFIPYCDRHKELAMEVGKESVTEFNKKHAKES